jgi:hypothetical protein
VAVIGISFVLASSSMIVTLLKCSSDEVVKVACPRRQNTCSWSA